MSQAVLEPAQAGCWADWDGEDQFHWDWDLPDDHWWQTAILAKPDFPDEIRTRSRFPLATEVAGERRDLIGVWATDSRATRDCDWVEHQAIFPNGEKTPISSGFKRIRVPIGCNWFHLQTLRNNCSCGFKTIRIIAHQRDQGAELDLIHLCDDSILIRDGNLVIA